MPKILKDEQIYSAVIQLVAERGYTGATTKEMASAANVSEVTLFRKYGSKQQLVKEAISSLISTTELASAAQYSGDIHADLTRFVKAYQNSAVKYGGFITALFSEMVRHPELVDSIDEPLNIFMAMGEIISRYQEEGELQKEHPLHMLAVLLGPVMYIAMMRKAIQKYPLPPFDLSAHVTHFLDGHRS
jgi:AcrR family transcriptional regulator